MSDVTFNAQEYRRQMAQYGTPSEQAEARKQMGQYQAAQGVREQTESLVQAKNEAARAELIADARAKGTSESDIAEFFHSQGLAYP